MVAKVAGIAGTAPMGAPIEVSLPDRPGPVKRAFRRLMGLVWMAFLIPAMLAALPFLFLIAIVVARMDPRALENEAPDFR
jgi:hypothetical protein